jgi:predicted secreted protein
MRTFLCLCAAILLTLCLAAQSFAGDYANLRFIGFSNDGKYLAFEEWGEGDPGGWYSTIYFVDVDKNSFAIAPLALTDQEGTKSLSALRRKSETLAAKTLRKLKIVPGNTGRLLAAHLLNDWTYDDSFINTGKGDKVKFNGYLNPNSPNQSEFYELTLKTVADEKAQCSNRTDYGVNKFELVLNYTASTPSNNYSQILQKDSILPARRNCPYGYRIESVYFYNDDKIVVFLNVFSYGFEGPDMRYMVVTASMDYETWGFDYFKKSK